MTDDRVTPKRALADELIGNFAGLLDDARPAIRMHAGLLTGLAIGISLEAGLARSPLRLGGVAGAISLVLLLLLASCWLISLVMLLLAGQPLLSLVSEHRWRSGAPVDPRVPWPTATNAEVSPQESLRRALLMISAARIRLDRVQTALVWASASCGLFLAWTVMVFAVR